MHTAWLALYGEILGSEVVDEDGLPHQIRDTVLLLQAGMLLLLDFDDSVGDPVIQPSIHLPLIISLPLQRQIFDIPKRDLRDLFLNFRIPNRHLP